MQKSRNELGCSPKYETIKVLIMLPKVIHNGILLVSFPKPLSWWGDDFASIAT